MRRTAPLLAVLLFAVFMAPARAAAQATTIIFVRHAEAGVGDPRNPTLTPAGEERAKALAKSLAGAGVSAVYTSHLERTKQTGAAVAKAAGVPAEAIAVNTATLDADAAALIARIVSTHAGGTVLVVGHSNTVPLMVSKATGKPVDPIADTEFDRMYVVTIQSGVARVVQAKY